MQWVFSSYHSWLRRDHIIKARSMSSSTFHRSQRSHQISSHWCGRKWNMTMQIAELELFITLAWKLETMAEQKWWKDWKHLKLYWLQYWQHKQPQHIQSVRSARYWTPPSGVLLKLYGSNWSYYKEWTGPFYCRLQLKGEASVWRREIRIRKTGTRERLTHQSRRCWQYGPCLTKIGHIAEDAKKQLAQLRRWDVHHVKGQGNKLSCPLFS